MFQLAIQNCVKARMDLRSHAFSSSVRGKPLVRDLIRSDIFSDSLFPPGSYDKIQTLIGPKSVSFFLAPGKFSSPSGCRNNQLFRARNSTPRYSSSYRKTPYSTRNGKKSSHNSSQSSSFQTSQKSRSSSASPPRKYDAGSSSRGSSSHSRGSSRAPSRGRGRGFSN